MLPSALHVLADFDIDAPDGETESPVEQMSLVVEPLGISQAIETARKIEEACARVREVEREAADDRLHQALDQEAAAFATELAAARRAWAENEAAALSTALAVALDDLTTRIANVAAMALRPFLVERVRDRALADLTDCIAKILADPDHPALAVSGPADLLDRVAAALAADADWVSFLPGAGPDIQVVAGATIIETRIQEWVARLGRNGE